MIVFHFGLSTQYIYSPCVNTRCPLCPVYPLALKLLQLSGLFQATGVWSIVDGKVSYINS